MFCGDMKERGEVKVPDITTDTFSQMLRYLYCEEADVTGESVMQIMYTAKKYLLTGLTKQCTDYLKKHLSGANAATILEQCLLFDETEMVSKCMEVIGEQTSEVLQSESFSKISNETLVKVLECDGSSVGEVELFKGSVDWARCKISKKSPSGDIIRDTLGKALYKLRFPVMTIGYIVQKNKPKSILFPTTPRVDMSCEYIHLAMDDNRGSVITREQTYIVFTIHNNTSNVLYLKGFLPYESIYNIAHVPTNINYWVEFEFQTQAAGTCPHNKGKTCVTFPVITIPARSSYLIRVSAYSGKMSCIPTDSGLTFIDSKSTISVLLTGEIPITEIIMAKGTT